MYTIQIGESRCVHTPAGPAHLRIYLVGPHPILRYFLDKMGFERIVGECLGPGRDMILTHAQTLKLLVQNIILSPAPLYRIAEWVAPVSAFALGISPQEKESINDDRVARSLDALVSPRARNIFFRLALHIIKQFEVQTRRIHHDTTTVTFKGSYESSVSEPRITSGINKDHRPDLKQLVFGINVTADGAVPLSHGVYSGNKTDDTIHRANVDQIREILGRDDFIYVADCKLCTRKNMSYIDGYGGKFVTVLPRTRAEDRQFREQLRQKARVRWRRLLVLENKRRKSDPPDIYWSTADGPSRTTEGYRIVWCRSSQKAKCDARSRETTLQKAEVELFDLGTRLNRYKLRTRTAIRRQYKAILQNQSCERFLNVTIMTTTQIGTKRLRPGRPGKSDAIRQVRSRTFSLHVQRQPEALAAESRTDGVFPLVSNIHPKHAPKKQVLLIYKYQPYVEKRHSLLKSELEVAPVYLKKPRRVAGLVHAHFLAITLDALIERTVRQAMQRHRIQSLPILPEARETKTPTTARILEMFTNVSWHEFKRGGETITFPIQLSKLQRLLLKLLEMDNSAYI